MQWFQAMKKQSDTSQALSLGICFKDSRVELNYFTKIRGSKSTSEIIATRVRHIHSMNRGRMQH